MAFIQAIYDGVKYDLDVLEDTPIRVDISAIENNDIGEVFGAASQQFTLPGSKKNNRFFKHAYKVGVSGVPGLGESVDAAVISKSDTLLEGSLFLDEVVRTPNGGYNYEVTITNNVVTFNEAVKTTAIRDLEWDDYDHNFTTANVTGSWSNLLFSGDVYYPLIDQGRDGLETTGSLPNVAIDIEEDTPRIGFINASGSAMQVQQFTPAIRVSTVLDKIFSAGNFTYSSSLQPLFQNLYIMPKQTEDLSVKGSGFSGFGFIASSSADQTGITEATGYVTASINTEIFDEAGQYNPATYTYTIGKSGTYQFRGVINYEIEPEDTEAQLIGRIRNITQNQTFASTNYEATEITGSFTVESDLVNASLNDEIQLQMRYIQGTGVGALEASIMSGSNFATLRTPLNYETGTIKIGEQFEPQTKCIDVLRGLIQKLNLVIEPVYTQNKVLKIETFNNWANSGKKVDWTRKIQQADRVSLRSTLSTQQKTLQYEDNKDNDKLSKQVIDNAEGFQWGTEVVNAASNVPQGERKVGAYFSPVILDKIIGGDATNVIPQLYKTDNTEVGKKSFKWKPRLGYKVSGSLSQLSYIGNNADTFQDYATIMNYSEFPVVSGSTDNLHFNESFYPPAFDVSATGSITSYTTYWNSYIQDLYDTDSKVLSAQIKFEPDEIANIELNDKIFVEDKWYRINKIKGYNLNYNDVVGLELITVNDAGFPSVICDFEFDIETTTTTTTTTTSTTTTTTSTTTAAPNKVIELSSFNSASVEYGNLQLQVSSSVLEYQPIPTGSFETSSNVYLTGSVEFTSTLSDNFRDTDWIARWKGDGSLLGIDFGSDYDGLPITSSRTIDTNLYSTMSVDWEVSSSVSTLTLLDLEFDLSASGYTGDLKWVGSFGDSYPFTCNDKFSPYSFPPATGDVIKYYTWFENNEVSGSTNYATTGSFLTNGYACITGSVLDTFRYFISGSTGGSYTASLLRDGTQIGTQTGTYSAGASTNFGISIPSIYQPITASVDWKAILEIND